MNKMYKCESVLCLRKCNCKNGNVELLFHISACNEWMKVLITKCMKLKIEWVKDIYLHLSKSKIKCNAIVRNHDYLLIWNILELLKQINYKTYNLNLLML